MESIKYKTSEEMKQTAEDHKPNSTETERQSTTPEDDAMEKSEEMKQTAEDHKP